MPQNMLMAYFVRIVSRSFYENMARLAELFHWSGVIYQYPYATLVRLLAVMHAGLQKYILLCHATQQGKRLIIKS